VALTPENWQRINELFDQALNSDNTSCLHDEDEEIVLEVRSLLAAHHLAASFLAAPAGKPKRPKELQPGDVIGDFWIIRKLGQGSIATVYLAEQTSLGRKVALKVAPNIGEEGRNMAPLEHDHIVRVFAEAVDTANNQRWTCMQFVAGLPLDQLIARIAALSPAERNGRAILKLLDESSAEPAMFDPAALQDRENLADLDYVDACLWIVSRLAQALDYAHRRGVLHLDVKPANILMSPYGRPLLTDFNVSQRGEGGPIKGGTLNYMSPEQSRGFSDQHVRVDGRADVFSLGKLLKEMLDLGTGNFVEIDRVLRKCTAENPAHRLNAAETIQYLESLLEQRCIERQLPTPGALTRFTQRHPTAAVLFFIFAPQLLGSAVNITYNFSRIVALLTVQQQAAFQEFVIYYNLLLYPLCLVIAWRNLSPVFRPMLHVPLEKKRKRVLQLPDWLNALCLLGWMPGSILFPAWIHWRTGSLSATVYGHFFISFTLSCLIAMTYSYLYTHYLMIRVFYPRLWTGTRGIQKIAQGELKYLPATMRFFFSMAGIIPLAAAALILWSGPSPTFEFRALLTALLGMGIIGLLTALRSSGLFAQTMYAFTGVRN